MAGVNQESIEVARNIAVVALPVVLIATWLVRAYAPDDDEARFRRLQIILLRVNVAVGFIVWLLAVLADPEHLGRNRPSGCVSWRYSRAGVASGSGGDAS